MSNELKTHRLIVTLPNTSGEEADTASQHIEDMLRDATNALVYPTATVTHALGESLPEHLSVEPHEIHGDLFNIIDLDRNDRLTVTKYEARQLAGVLLGILGVTDAEPSE